MQFHNFKQTINKFATGVTVVTGYYNNTPFGVTVNSFTSLSLEPKLILFNLDKKISSLNAFFNTSYFNINILSSHQKNIATIFAEKNIDRFAQINYHISCHNTPILPEIHSLLQCKKVKVIAMGDHYIFICNVLDTMVDNSKKPLLYYNSRFYHHIS